MFTIYITLNSGEKVEFVSGWFQLVPFATRPRVQFYLMTTGQTVYFLDEIHVLDIKPSPDGTWQYTPDGTIRLLTNPR